MPSYPLYIAPHDSYVAQNQRATNFKNVLRYTILYLHSNILRYKRVLVQSAYLRNTHSVIREIYKIARTYIIGLVNDLYNKF